MKQKSISLIIGLMSIALLGVMAMQYYFIRESYLLKSQLFDQSVNEALNAVVSKLEKQDAMLFLKRKAEGRIKLEYAQKSQGPTRIETNSPQKQAQDFAKQLKIRQQKIDKDFNRRDSLLRQRYPKALVINNDFYETYFKDPDEWNKVRFQVNIQQNIDPYGRVFQDKFVDLYAEEPDWASRKLKKSSNDSVHYLVEDPMLGFQVVSLAKVNPKLKKDLKDEEKKQVGKVTQYLDSVKFVKQKSAIFEDLAHEYEQAYIPLSKRINSKIIDDLLQKELLNRGINLPYNYRVSSANSDSVIFTKASTEQPEKNGDNMYKTSLFPKETVRETGILLVTFPNKPSIMFKNMDVLLVSSASLLLVLIGCFTYTILIIFRQKKISEMKTDFINNMTHEFKTPVATIMIASEALKDPEVVEDKKRIDRLAKIIYDENIRLGSHIERVLNIAKIDKGDLKLEESEVEMHDLISAVVASMSLQLEKKHAIIGLDFSATRSIIKGDELHLSNVILNLLDNAVKYSKETPEINVSTYNSSKNFVVKVTDKGIGMSKDQLSKIFDQFYRIPTGNLHDVKGFGLGLSYVSNIVKHLQGTINVKSEKDKGSVFEIGFPTLEELPEK